MMRSKKRTASNARQVSAVLLGQDGVGKSGKELYYSPCFIYQLLTVSLEILAKLYTTSTFAFVCQSSVRDSINIFKINNGFSACNLSVFNEQIKQQQGTDLFQDGFPMC